MVVVWHLAMLLCVHPPGTHAYTRAPILCNTACCISGASLSCLPALALTSLHAVCLNAAPGCRKAWPRTSRHPEQRCGHGPGGLRSKQPGPDPLPLGGAGPGVPPAQTWGVRGVLPARSAWAVQVAQESAPYTPILLGLAEMVMCLSSSLRYGIVMYPAVTGYKHWNSAATSHHDNVQHRHGFLSVKDGCAWDLLTVSRFSSLRYLEASQICKICNTRQFL